MKEYYGKSATYYKQTGGRNLLLFPAIKKYLLKGGKLLDVGCGNADFGIFAHENNLEYFGLDVSEDMLEEARKNFSKGKYLRAPSTNFALKYNFNLDVIIISMLFPAFSNHDDIIETLKECEKVLTNSGKIIIGIAHPLYDQYMQFGLFKKKNIETNFEGYFEFGKKFLIHKNLNGNKMILEDYHWTLTDYFTAIKKANLKIVDVDECLLDRSLTQDEDLIKKKSKFPTYLVLVVEKDN